MPCFFSILTFSKPLIISISIPLVGGYLSAFFVNKSAMDNWYKDLKKPSGTPPNYVFPIAWTFLYITMGLASFLVYKTTNQDTSRALQLYAAQLLLNFAWTPVFFGLKWMLVGAFHITSLLGLVTWTAVEFYRINAFAGYLMVPYIAWVGYATRLNWRIWQLNFSLKKQD